MEVPLNLSQPGRADYAHHITTCPSRFSNLPPSLTCIHLWTSYRVGWVVSAMHYIYNSKDKPPNNAVSSDLNKFANALMALKYQALSYRLFAVWDGNASRKISRLKSGSSYFVSGTRWTAWDCDWSSRLSNTNQNFKQPRCHATDLTRWSQTTSFWCAVSTINVVFSKELILPPSIQKPLRRLRIKHFAWLALGTNASWTKKLSSRRATTQKWNWLFDSSDTCQLKW